MTNVPGRVHVDEEAADDAADADAEVEQREVDAEVALPQLGRDEVADEALDAGQTMPKPKPMSTSATAACPVVVASASTMSARSSATRRRVDPPRPDAVDERPGRRHEQSRRAAWSARSRPTRSSAKPRTSWR